MSIDRWKDKEVVVYMHSHKKECIWVSSNVEKAMAPYFSTVAWKIPRMEEPGGLQSMGSLRVGHDWATSLSLFTFMHWRRNWQPTPGFLPGESQGWGSLMGCPLWGRRVGHDWSNLAAAAATRWMNVEPIIQSEVSQKEKDEYYILIRIYEI